MDDYPSAIKPNTPLRRRKSIATSVVVVVPSKLILPTKPHHHHNSFPPSATAITTTSSFSSSSPSSSSSSSVDFELNCIKPISSYTSLKDLLPSSPAAGLHSPTTASAPPAPGEISIRNRLVKQAAWAYLQPMSISPDPACQCFLHRLWTRISGGDFLKRNPLAAFVRFIDQHVVRPLTHLFDWLYS